MSDEIPINQPPQFPYQGRLFGSIEALEHHLRSLGLVEAKVRSVVTSIVRQSGLETDKPLGINRREALARLFAGAVGSVLAPKIFVQGLGAALGKNAYKYGLGVWGKLIPEEQSRALMGSIRFSEPAGIIGCPSYIPDSVTKAVLDGRDSVAQALTTSVIKNISTAERLAQAWYANLKTRDRQPVEAFDPQSWIDFIGHSDIIGEHLHAINIHNEPLFFGKVHRILLTEAQLYSNRCVRDVSVSSKASIIDQYAHNIFETLSVPSDYCSLSPLEKLQKAHADFCSLGDPDNIWHYVLNRRNIGQIYQEQKDLLNLKQSNDTQIQALQSEIPDTHYHNGYINTDSHLFPRRKQERMRELLASQNFVQKTMTNNAKCLELYSRFPLQLKPGFCHSLNDIRWAIENLLKMKDTLETL